MNAPTNPSLKFLVRLFAKSRANLPDPRPSPTSDALDQTLARLTTVPIPDGLEQRILNRLAAHAANQPAPGVPRPATTWLQRRFLSSLQHLAPPSARRLGLSLKPRPVLRAGMALAALAITVGGLRYMSTTTPPTTPTAHNKVQPQPGFAPLQPAITQPAPTLSAASPATRSLTPTRRPITSPIPFTQQSNQIVSADEALALAELHAPSQLAPPLPLTDDERALQHLARHSSPSTIEALNADHRASQEATEQAAFQTFFTPPTYTEKQLRGESE